MHRLDLLALDARSVLDVTVPWITTMTTKRCSLLTLLLALPHSCRRIRVVEREKEEERKEKEDNLTRVKASSVKMLQSKLLKSSSSKETLTMNPMLGLSLIFLRQAGPCSLNPNLLQSQHYVLCVMTWQDGKGMMRTMHVG